MNLTEKPSESFPPSRPDKPSSNANDEPAKKSSITQSGHKVSITKNSPVSNQNAKDGADTAGLDTAKTATDFIFKSHRENIQESLKNSKEYKQLKDKFLIIAEKKFDKIYASNFQGKHDTVREAFIEKHAEELLESFLKNVRVKPGTEINHELHASWEELLNAMSQTKTDPSTFDEKQPFGPSGTLTVHLKSSNLTIIFTEKNGLLSAQVGDHIYQTKKKGLKGILKLQSEIYLTGNQTMEIAKKTVEKCHKQALESFGKGTSKKSEHLLAEYLQHLSAEYLHSASHLLDKEEKNKIGLQGHEAIYEASKFGGYEIPKITGNYQALDTGTMVTGGFGAEFGALAIAEGFFALSEALQNGISDHDFLKLYDEFKVQFNEKNPKLNDVDKFNLKEIEQIAKTMRNYSKVKSLGAGGSLHVLLGTAKILAATGLMTHASVLAASGSGVVGGLLIVSGSLEMAEACRKLRKLEKRSAAVESTENKIVNSQEITSYQEGLARSFLELQADMIDNEKTRENLSLTSGGGMVVGGTMLVAATVAGVAGAAGFGVGAAAVLGGVAVMYLGGQGYLFYKDHEIKHLQTKLLMQDIAQVRAAKEKGVKNPYKNMQSTAGKLVELYKAVRAEQNNKKKGTAAPLSEHLVQRYMGMHPKQFMKVMKGMDLKLMASLKDENVISTGMFIKNEGLAQAAMTAASNVKEAGFISGYKVNASIAEFAKSSKKNKAMLENAELKEAELEVKRELRTLNASIHNEENKISKETKVRQKLKKELDGFSKNIGPDIKAMQAAESEVAQQKQMISEVINKLLSCTSLAKSLLTEASNLASGKKAVWEGNTEVEYKAQDAMGDLDKEIKQANIALQFTLRNTTIKNSVEAYNTLLEQIELLNKVKKGTANALDLLKGVVSNLREDKRAEYAITDGNKALNKLTEEKKNNFSKSVSELANEKVNAKKP